MRKQFSIIAILFFFVIDLILPFHCPLAQAEPLNPGVVPLLPALVDCSDPPVPLPAVDFERLLAGLEEKINSSEPDPETLIKQAEATANQERYEKAIVLYTKVLELKPDFPKVRGLRGFAYSETDQFDLALEDLTRNIEENPSSAKAYYSRGNAYFYQGDDLSALEDFKKSLSIDPSEKCAHNNMGLTYQSLGNTDAALVHFNQALTIDPKFEKALLNRGDLYMERGSYLHALGDYLHAWWLSIT